MKLKVFILCLSLIAAVFAVSAKSFAASDIIGGACTGEAAKSAVCEQAKNTGSNNPVAGPNGVISKTANVLAAVGGAVAVIMIIVSGFMFVTAGGTPGGQRSTDPNQIKKARATLTGALVGLIVIALAWTITRFVTDHIIP